MSSLRFRASTCTQKGLLSPLCVVELPVVPAVLGAGWWMGGGSSSLPATEEET